MLRHVVLGLCLLFALPARAQPSASLRSIDRATVRVLAIYGIEGNILRGSGTEQLRNWASFRWGHGSGVVVDRDGLVLTARHVVEAADFVVVRLPGRQDVLPARVVYLDFARDLAFLRIPGPVAASFPIPSRPPALETGQHLSASGYPLDAAARTPAAASGELSRVTEEGLLQVAMPLNPGNSGGPVVGPDGKLVGIVSMRGRIERGVQGVGYLEPVSSILEARRALHESAVANLAPGEIDGVVARFASRALEQDTRQPWGGLDLAREITEAAPRVAAPEQAALVSAWAWNVSLHILEQHHAREAAALPPPLRAPADALRSVALQSAQSALAQAPYLPRRYPFLAMLVRSQGRQVMRSE
jgi:S1-C subfamily serine protease